MGIIYRLSTLIRSSFFFLMTRPPPRSTLFPYPTLFRSCRPFSRRSSIHPGSSFSAEISRTTSSDRPRRAMAPAASESDQPNLYRSRPSSSGRAVVRSEEHTSELQSHLNLLSPLLLDKKK